MILLNKALHSHGLVIPMSVVRHKTLVVALLSQPRIQHQIFTQITRVLVGVVFSQDKQSHKSIHDIKPPAVMMSSLTDLNFIDGSTSIPVWSSEKQLLSFLQCVVTVRPSVNPV
ncbi:hypothetical protein OH492_15695 [Vibrio chagasii]|nr:hypothetical protein [Vibrio chagasii]